MQASRNSWQWRNTTPMEQNLAARIDADPNYQRLKQTRSRFGWTLTIAMLVVYYGYVLLIAFDKTLLSTRIGSGAMTWGIPLGFGVIIFTLVVTGIYVRRANREFDALNDQIKREALK